MSLSKLSIFTKDTDASETIKGYEYQKLRTLESWLENYVKRGNHVIYCDYEEDIFLRDQKDWVSKFIQLKLYSSKNFSFSSVEVTKAISHFFILFVKGEYKFDEVEFVFETNVSVAGKYKDNDADLLKNWKDNQNSLSQELLDKCVEKVKSIISEYVKPFGNKVKDKALLKEINEAKIILDELPNNVWIDFVKSIKWNFDELPADVAINHAINRIYDLIEITGYVSSIRDKVSVFASLYYTVSEKSMEAEPENRKLDHKLLDSVLLSIGDKDDKWYNENYQIWHDIEKVTYFLASEFYQVLHSTNFCRTTPYIKSHSDLWKNFLIQYLELENTPLYLKRKAIYELAWLSFPIKRRNPKPEGSLKGIENDLRLYYETLEEFSDHDSVEDAQNLLGLLKGAIASHETEISEDEVEKWEIKISELINEKLKHPSGQTEECYFNDIAASLLMQQAILAEPDTVDKIFNHFQRVFDLLDQAPMFDVVRLSNRINEYIKLLIHHHADINLIERLEDFSDKLMPIANEKKGNFTTAKIYTERGVKYLNSTEPKSILRALNYFHKSKELYRNDGTLEGFILALLNISQLYSASGSNFAAKYYALSAIWQSTQNTDLHGRIADGFGLLLHYDFDQGAWISCLEDFRLYIRSRIDFKNPEIDVTKDQMLMKCFTLIASTIALLPRISNQLFGLIEYEKQKMGELYSQEIEHLVYGINENITTDNSINEFVERKCRDAVINDIGAIRKINWFALGTSWELVFRNDWLETSLGEEVTACLQILLLQFAVSPNDFHFIKGNVSIEMILSDEFLLPEQQPSNDSTKWKLYLIEAKNAEQSTIKLQAGYLTGSLKVILNQLSLLPKEEFDAEFERFFKEEDLAGKTLPGYLYQRIYRNLFSEESFDSYQRDKFFEERRSVNIEESTALKWDDSISNKYSFEKSIELIRGRYKHCIPQIHLTLQKIKGDSRYNMFISSLRKERWLDWQITMAIYNHILNYKAHRELEQIRFKTESDFINAFEDKMWKLGKIDEKDNFISFDLDFFLTEDFKFHLKNTAIIVLQRWELENKCSYPNFQAIHDVLSSKFSFDKDDFLEDSPL
ncbi:dsDNA nuclease domain-containing protein [Parapedobacter deserti]|uniref:DsDNA nuclease domain-containing protein n=1 Tax=Parapedobacter deserti TaxID=1912957 RepID=A0ABV7JN35_9SPHI